MFLEGWGWADVGWAVLALEGGWVEVEVVVDIATSADITFKFVMVSCITYLTHF